MKKETVKALKRKGWSEDDIHKAQKIIESRKTLDTSRSSVYSNRVLFWTVIIVMIFGNFIISLLLVPFLLVFNSWAMDAIVIFIGLAFGSLFNLVIMDIENVSQRHRFAAGILIPALALINISVMVNMANALNDVLRVSVVRDNPITISILYVVAFVLPFLWSIFVSKKLDIAYKGKGLYESKETEMEFLKKY